MYLEAGISGNCIKVSAACKHLNLTDSIMHVCKFNIWPQNKNFQEKLQKVAEIEGIKLNN